MREEPITVLVIDTDNVRRGMLACNLPTSRFELEFAKTAERGLDLLSQQRPQVVIVGLDDQTRDLLQRIRLLPAGADCLLVLIHEETSGGVTAPGEIEALGADVSLVFPFPVEQLEAEIRQHPATDRDAALAASDVAHPAQSSPRAGGERPPAATEWRAFRERVEQRHATLDQLDYYQLLETDHGAPASEIKQCYFQRSMEYHPDRFMRLDDDVLRCKIYEVYKRVSEAFRVLSQPHARSGYDQQLAGPPEGRSLRFTDPERARGRSTSSSPGGETPAGRRYLRYAEQAVQEGDLKSARVFLTLAVQCEPGNDALHARLDALSSPA